MSYPIPVTNLVAVAKIESKAFRFLKKAGSIHPSFSISRKHTIVCHVSFFMPPPRSGEGHIVLPLSVRTYIHTYVRHTF